MKNRKKIVSAPGVDRWFEDRFDLRLSPRELADLYGRCIPGTLILLTRMRIRHGRLSYAVNWVDSAGAIVGRSVRVWQRDQDGAAVLSWHGFWLSRSFRGRGVAGRVVQTEFDLLRAASGRERTRVVLRAGEHLEERVGAYLWATYGFDFAFRHGVRACETPMPRCVTDFSEATSLNDLQLLRREFGPWLQRAREAGHLRGGDAEIRAAVAGVEAWLHPWDIARYRWPGIGLKRDPASDQDERLGRAYLSSRDAPQWEGVLFVHRSQAVGTQMFLQRCHEQIGKTDRTTDTGHRRLAATPEMIRVLEATTCDEKVHPFLRDDAAACLRQLVPRMDASTHHLRRREGGL